MTRSAADVLFFVISLTIIFLAHRQNYFTYILAFFQYSMGVRCLLDRKYFIKGCSYTWECLEQGEYYVIEFKANFSDNQLYSFHIPENNTILKAFTQIENALSFATEYAQMECMRELYDLLIFLISSHKTAYVPPAKLQLLKPALGYMANHYSDANITNNFLAQMCDVSTIYFRKVFFSQYQVPPIKYLQNLRMEKTKNMLTSDYESISQFAESVGYNSIYHFSKMFKACTGMSPSEYASCFHAKNNL